MGEVKILLFAKLKLNHLGMANYKTQ